jgi:hypothetical protein
VIGAKEKSMKAILGAALAAAVIGWSSPAVAGGPETVHVTYHIRRGSLGKVIELLGRQYTAGRKAGIVLAEPHLVLSGKEDGGKPVVVEVLTWRSANDPDEVSTKYPDIQAIWSQLNELVEARGRKTGIQIEAMQIETPRREPSR